MNTQARLWRMITGMDFEALPQSAEGLYKTASTAMGTSKILVPGVVEDGRGGYTVAYDAQEVPYTVLRIWEDDAGKTLKHTQRHDSYGGTLKEALLPFFDGNARIERLKTKVNKVLRNRTTVVFGVTPAQMTENTDVADWETGFFSRFLIFMDTQGYRTTPERMSVEECERIESFAISMAKTAFEESKRSVDVAPRDGRPTVWKHYSKTEPENPKAFKTKAAWTYYQDSKAWIQEETRISSRYARGPIQRGVTKMMRLAELYEWQHPTRPKLDQWKFSLDSLERSRLVIEWHIRSTRLLAEIVAADPFNRLCLDILDCMAHRPGYSWSLDEIHGKLPQRSPIKKVIEALEALVSRFEIRSTEEFSGSVKGSAQKALYVLTGPRSVLRLR
jgi:hypothetical protein